MNKSTPATVAALAALAVVGGAALTGASSQAASGDQTADQRPQQRTSARAKAVSSCDGAMSKGLLTRTSADPFSFVGTSNADVAVPGAAVTVRGPRRGTDTLLITYSAES